MRLCLLLLLLPAAAFAQTPAQTPGEPAKTQEFPSKPHHSAREEDEPVALALNLAVGATVWSEVKVSTAGSLGDLNLLVHEGFYKRELIELVVISVDARRPLRDIVDRRRKGLRLATIAREAGLDASAVERQALGIEDVLDRDYLKRFPDHKLKNAGSYYEAGVMPWW